ncbi:MAG TPA: iron-containing alcohol dehydrogenase [Candidatus Anoxymicrobiaceae bacterium]
MDMYFFEFKVPGRTLCWDGGSARLGKPMQRFGGSRILVVTDKGVRGAGLIEPVIEGIEQAGPRIVGVFDDVPSDPGITTIETCTRLARELEIDGLVSIGGGSSIDTAKATIILLCEGGDLRDHEWNEYFASSPVLPHIAIPTTAGTGSEATHVAMITDEGRDRKLMYQGGDLIPRMAVLDPRMTVSLPAHITAATGMDALTHAVEALHSLWHQPMTDGLALQAIELVDGFLEKCFTDGGDIFARMNMLLAANMGGVAASNSFIGIVHATAHPLGALFHIPHGVGVGMMLPYCMEMNMAYDGIPAIYRKVAEALGIARESDDDETASRKAIERVRGLVSSLGLPTTLKEAGVPADSLKAYIDEVMEDRAMMVTPGNPGRKEVEELISRAYCARCD